MEADEWERTACGEIKREIFFWREIFFSTWFMLFLSCRFGGFLLESFRFFDASFASACLGRLEDGVCF